MYTFTISGDLYKKQKIGELETNGLFTTSYKLIYNPNNLFYLTPRTGVLKINKPAEIIEGIYNLVAVLNEEQQVNIDVIVKSKYITITLPTDKKEYYLKLIFK